MSVSYIENRGNFRFYEDNIVDSHQWKMDADRIPGMIGTTISFHEKKRLGAYMTGTIVAIRRLDAGGMTNPEDVGRVVITFVKDISAQDITHTEGWGQEKKYW